MDYKTANSFNFIFKGFPRAFVLLRSSIISVASDLIFDLKCRFHEVPGCSVSHLKCASLD